jgi:hypothetical protein
MCHYFQPYTSMILGTPTVFLTTKSFYYLELLRASEGTLSRWSRLHLQSLAPTNPHWARVAGYDPFSLCVIHKVPQQWGH